MTRKQLRYVLSLSLATCLLVSYSLFLATNSSLFDKQSIQESFSGARGLATNPVYNNLEWVEKHVTASRLAGASLDLFRTLMATNKACKKKKIHVSHTPKNFSWSVSQLRCQTSGSTEHLNKAIVTTMDSSFLFLFPGFLESFVTHNTGFHRIIFLVMDITEEQLESLCRFSTQKHPEIVLEFYLFNAKTVQELFYYKTKSKGFLKHIPIGTMLRLLVPETLSSEIDSIIYLDLDTLVVGPIGSLLEGQCNQLRETHETTRKPHICARLSEKNTLKAWVDPQQYCTVTSAVDNIRLFNAGVLYLDIVFWRNWGMVPFSLAMSQQLHLNDQLLLNLMASHDSVAFEKLDHSFNIWLVYDNLQSKTEKPKILHSVSPDKAWISEKNKGHSTWAQYIPGHFLFVWSFIGQILPPTAEQSVLAAANNLFGYKVTVICATTECSQRIKALGHKSVTVVQLHIKDFINTPSPLSDWFRRQSLYKIWTGKHFPKFFQKAVELSALYSFGGILLDWGIEHIPDKPILASYSKPWCETIGSGFQVAYFPKKSTELKKAAEDFLFVFSSYDPFHHWPLAFPEIQSKSCPFSVPEVTLLHDYVSQSFGVLETRPILPKVENHYGVLWLDSRVAYLNKNAANLGDEVQGIASAQWLPFVDFQVERDDLFSKNVTQLPKGSITTVMNAWWGTPTMKWPPPKSIDPVLVSMHLEKKVYKIFKKPKSRQFLKAHEPIGARDTATQKFFQSLGVKSFLSYCMTTTLMPVKSLYLRKKNPCKTLVVDVKPELLERFPSQVISQACYASPKWIDNGQQVIKNGLARYTKAYELLEKYATAELVITSRLHAALPSAAMGAPVVLVLGSSMPGGGNGHNDGRFSGLQELVHTVDFGNATAALKFLDRFSWHSPPPNPGQSQLSSIQCNLLRNLAKNRPLLRDSISVFNNGVSCNLVSNQSL